MEILEHVELRDMVTLRAGGSARFFAVAHTVSDITKATAFAKREKLPLIPIGSGSNILPSDGVLNVFILKINLLGIEEGRKEVVVGAGEDWDQFVEKTISSGYYDLANLSAIPGTVGAAPIQNIGAYGSEVAESIDWVEAYDVNQERLRVFTTDECKFSYRNSRFKRKKDKFIITRVAFRLSEQKSPNIKYKDLAYYFQHNTKTPSPKEIRDAVIVIRSRKFPNLEKIGTAGSFFLNPVLSLPELERVCKLFPDIPTYTVTDEAVKVPLAYILERLGLKDICEGDVCTYINQPLVLINKGTKSAENILTFAKHIEKSVFENTKIKIKKEVRVVG